MAEVSFLAVPSRDISDSDGVNWQLRIRGGWAWDGWRWLTRLDRFNWESAELLALVPVILVGVCEGPVRMWRRAVYRKNRRTDWVAEALVSSEHGYDVVVRYREPTREAAAERALSLLADIRARRLVVNVGVED